MCCPQFFKSVAAVVVLAHSLVYCEEYCHYPDLDPESRTWKSINLRELVPDLIPHVDNDMNVYVDSVEWAEYSGPGDILDDYHLEQFIRGIWRSHSDNDIRTIWNYFAAYTPAVEPPDTLWEYGGFGTDQYNFKYPDLWWLEHRNLTEVEVYLIGGMDSGGSASGNIINIDMAGHLDDIEDVPDWWYVHDWAGRTFCHEFQHTVHSCFDRGEDLEEAFAEAATSVAGCKKINVGFPHSLGVWPRFDLVFNNGIPRGISSQDPYFAYQTNDTRSKYNKYTGFWLWTTYVFEQFPGPSPTDITDDLLYKVLRTTDGAGEPLGNMHAFHEASANYAAPEWGFEDPDPALFHKIFSKWTIANVVDNKNFDPKYGYDIQDVRIRTPEEYGTGWLRDNEDGFCNDPENYGQSPDYQCGAWEPPLIELDLGENDPYVLRGESDCSWDPVVGIELYAADYVKFVPAGIFPQNTVLSLAFDVSDEDNAWDSNNVLMHIHVVGYDPLSVASVNMTQSEFPGYDDLIYHHVDGFESIADSIHTVVSSMENAVGISGRYPMRGYSITATAVPSGITASGYLAENARWYSGQTVTVTNSPGVIVLSGVSLTIEPGVTVQFSSGCGLEVFGILVADGSSVLPITFTSSIQTPGAWTGIETGGPNCLLDLEDCIVEYADKGVRIAHSGLHVIRDNTFRHCNYGTYLDQVTLSDFTGSAFHDNITGMYMSKSSVTEEYGFGDLRFLGNEFGIKVLAPASGTTILRNSLFGGNEDCAIYFNQQNGSGDFEMRDLSIIGGSANYYAGIRTQGGNSEPKVRHCLIKDFLDIDGAGISCTAAGRVNAGKVDDDGNNFFDGNYWDIKYTIVPPGNPPNLYALENCWDGVCGNPDLCGNLHDLILTSEDCSAWDGFGVPPVPEEPQAIGLSIAYPNPMRSEVRIHYEVPEGLGGEEKARVRIYNLEGRLVRTLVEGNELPGSHSVDWDGLNTAGHPVGAGIYICRFESEWIVDTKRIVLMR